MDWNRRPKRSNPQFMKSGGGGGNKRGRFGEQSLSSSPGTSETVYRILCPSRKIASLLGKGGEIIKALREDTQAKITVAESVPGSEERVVMVYSPSAKLLATKKPVSEMPGSNATHGVDVYRGYAGSGGQNHTLQPGYHNYDLSD
uniref:KH domain-containing protein n=1 Tax=Tanacetum cinerariifolium TaxID=118510 RepID=A0A6L2KLR4_TANCI|nr:KH domain-containing protein [Tanacetum cinerariifolium]